MKRMIATLTFLAGVWAPQPTHLLCAGSLLALAAPSAAQGHSTGADIEKQMTEISRLMRESERLLLEMTKIDRLVEQQRRLVEELKKLEPPKQDANASNTEGAPDEEKPNEEKKAQQEAEKRQELQQKQAELRRKLEELFKNQDNASQSTVQRLEKLLRSLPSGGGGGGGGGQPDPNSPPKQGEDPENKEQKQNDGKKGEKKPKSGKESEERNEETGEDPEKQEEEKKARSQLARIEAWMARLPPAQQERISRNDFSGFPPRYRRLLREYTRLRAKREAEERPDDER